MYFHFSDVIEELIEKASKNVESCDDKQGAIDKAVLASKGKMILH